MNTTMLLLLELQSCFENGVEKWREDTPLRCTISAQDQWLRWQDVDRDHLRSVQKEVEDPLVHMGVNEKLAVFVEEFERNDSNCHAEP